MKNKKLEEKYIKKIEEIKERHKKYYDNEIIHSQFDELLLELLKELDYEKIVKLYEKESEHFWYA